MFIKYMYQTMKPRKLKGERAREGGGENARTVPAHCPYRVRRTCLRTPARGTGSRQRENSKVTSEVKLTRRALLLQRLDQLRNRLPSIQTCLSSAGKPCPLAASRRVKAGRCPCGTPAICISPRASRRHRRRGAAPRWTTPPAERRSLHHLRLRCTARAGRQ